jgi:hypothetical protein
MRPGVQQPEQLRSLPSAFTIEASARPRADMHPPCRALTLICALLVGGMVQPVRADEPWTSPPKPMRTALWLSTSATLLSASLAGVYALRVSAIYDRSLSLPTVSPELTGLHRDAVHAEHTADAFFIATALLATTTLVLLIAELRGGGQSETPARPPISLAASSHGATLVFTDRWQ